MVRRLGPAEREPPTAMVVDAKGLYDHLSRPSATAGSHEKRTLVDIKVMSHSVRLIKGLVKWVAGKIVISDSLTKKNGNGGLMRHVMGTGVFGISERAMREILENIGTVGQRGRASQKMDRHREHLAAEGSR